MSENTKQPWRDRYPLSAKQTLGLVAAIGAGVAGVAAAERVGKSLHFKHIAERYKSSSKGPAYMLESTRPDEKDGVDIMRSIVAATFMYENGVATPELRGITHFQPHIRDPLHAALRVLTAGKRPLLVTVPEGGDEDIYRPADWLREEVEKGEWVIELAELGLGAKPFSEEETLPLLRAQIDEYVWWRDNQH